MAKRPEPGERGDMGDMNCQETQKYLYAFLDEQLGLKESVDIEAHVSSCPDCQKKLEFEKELNDFLREHAPRWQAPDRLKKRIRRELRKTSAHNSLWTEIRTFLIIKPVYAVLGILLILSPLLYVHYAGFFSTDSHMIIRETVEDHLRSLLVENPAGISTSNPYEVASWFENKLEFALNIPQFKENTVALLGAQITYFLDRRVAHVMYKVREHKLSLYILEGAGIDVDEDEIEGGHAYYEDIYKGFTVVGWRSGSYIYCFVSDLSDSELDSLAFEAIDGTAG
jgi:mycothiol system anti-sigma-R factor